MPLKSSLKIFCICVTFFAAFSTSVRAQNSEIDIPKLLNEAKQKSDENWRKMIANYASYTFKWRKTWREANKDGAIKEKSELAEVFYPSKCLVKKCRSVPIFLEIDGKPVSAGKIEKERVKAGEKLEKMEADAQAQALPLRRDYPLHWMRFAYYVRRPFESEPKIIIKIDGQEILEKCEFHSPEPERVNGREAISLRFRPRPDAVFDEESKYAANVEGKIWIDAEDKVFFRLIMWQKGTKFEKETSDHLLENAALAYDLTRTKEGVWFHRLGRIRGIKHPFLGAQFKGDFSIENFDHHYFQTEIKNVEVGSPKQK